MFNADNETYVYTYNANGERIRKANTETGEGDYYMRDYLGRELVIYDNLTDEPKSANIYGNGLVGKIDVNGTTDNRSYYLKDHLGSIRCVLNANGSILNAQDFYPYGETIREYNGTSSKYKFTEKERDTESTYDYFGARYYDSKLGMWMQVDPLAEKYPGWSAYNYCTNNPLANIDEHGDSLRPVIVPNRKLFFIDTKIADNFEQLLQDAQTLGVSVSINSIFRTSEEQLQEKERWTDLGKPDNAFDPGNSPHEAGFAFDFQSITMSKLEYKIFRGLAKAYGFVRTNKERWHLEADPTKNQYRNKFHAIRENQKDYQRTIWERGKSQLIAPHRYYKN